CLRLNEVVIGNSVTTIESSAFNDCISLSKINLPNSLTAINSSAFYNCKSLESITIPNSVTEIDNYAFYDCSSLESVSLPEGMLKIADYTFYGCSALKEADIPFGTTTISNYAFKNCTALEKVTIPRTVKNIYNQAFMGCETLKEVNIADYSITEIKSDTFKDCPSIEKIVFPKGLTKIGSQAFMNCTSLVDITIPESVTSIETNALSYPDKTTIRGKKGSYAETFANENGFKFVDYSIPAEGIILKGDDDDHIDIELGETFYAEFEFYPEDANDVVTLKADNSNVTIKGHDITGYRAGDTTITANTTSGMEYEFTVHVRRVSEIKIITNPTKTTYLMGESFDPTGMEVQAVYNDGYSRVVDGWIVTGFDSSKEGQNTVTVKWIAPSGSSYTKTLTLTIVDPTPKLTGIYIETEPTKKAYELREKLDLTGMVVKGIYTDGSKKEITDYTTSGYNALKKGTHTITVTYEGFTDTFTVTVGETPTEPPKPELIIGDVDGDGKISVMDATEIQRHIAQLTTISEDRLSCADTDRDTRISIMDATQIQRFIAQLITSL
ncbi:MAG: leucine-rich repeat protein, partial [Ruminococcus sp.]|nr:leucine-rich repeat protein [Ruminococcus sp.]